MIKIQNIILISGKAEHGKNAVADIIKDKLINYKIVNIAYADYLKWICKSYMGWNGGKDTYGRMLLQKYGTEVIRSQVPDFWVRNVAQLLEVLQNEFDFVTISDCRFPNEINHMLKIFSEKVISLRVERPNYISALTEEQLKHLSETALDNYVFDYVIYNDGTIDDLEIKVDNFIKNELDLPLLKIVGE